MTIPAGQIASFKIHPDPRSRVFYRVRVFRSLETARTYTKTRDVGCAEGMTSRGLAMCSSFRVGRPPADGSSVRWTPQYGEIVFARRFLTGRIISHEATHAVFGWFRQQNREIGAGDVRSRPGRPGFWVHDAEEAFCEAQGELVRQIILGCEKAKLFP